MLKWSFIADGREGWKSKDRGIEMVLNPVIYIQIEKVNLYIKHNYIMIQ